MGGFILGIVSKGVGGNVSTSFHCGEDRGLPSKKGKLQQGAIGRSGLGEYR